MKKRFLCLFLLLCLIFCACASPAKPAPTPAPAQDAAEKDAGGEDSLPVYAGEPYVVQNGGKPAFSEELFTTSSFETYAELDGLGRCGAAFACLGRDLMPTGERGSIGSVKPSGWQTAKYDSVDGKYLYNRCHLIGWQLSGENANERNLITGTRYLNVEGMLPFENMVADYIKETGNHVLYRVTPVFVRDEPVARGVKMEAYSVEDAGDGIEFSVYCFNVQPGITIDYTTGKSALAAAQSRTEESTENKSGTFVLNTNTKKIHLPTCSSAQSMKPENRREYTGSLSELLKEGYAPCSICHPDR